SSVRSTFPLYLDASGAWSTRFETLPSWSNLWAGSYTIWAYTYDQAGNRSDSAITITVITDVTPPTLQFTDPAGSAVVTGLPVIRGTAVDNPGGTGVKVVQMVIYRQTDGMYWWPQYSAWTSLSVGFVVNFDPSSDNWDTVGIPLPDGPDLLPDGT